MRKQLRKFCVDLEISQQQAVAEALNMLFKKHGLPPIAEG